MDSKKKEFTPLKGILIILGFLIVATLIILGIIVTSATLNMVNPKKKEMTTFPAELGLYKEFVELKAPNGSIMAGWFISAQTPNVEEEPTPSDKTVIFSHNYESNKVMEEINGLYYVKDLVSRGFNVMLFDYSGSGSSTGKGYTFGSREVEELNSVVDYVYNDRGCKKIALQGWGFGAAVALMSGADNDKVSGIICDSSYVNLKDYFAKDLYRWSKIPSFFSPAVEMLIPVFSGSPLYSDSPLKAATRVTDKSLMFIEGEEENFFESGSYKVLASAAEESNDVNTWFVKGASHVNAFTEQEENYVERAVEFLLNAL